MEPGSTVYVDSRELTVRAVRRGDKGPQIAFEEIPDRTVAEALRGHDLFSASRRTLEPGEYWPEDLIGMRVRTVGGKELGLVVDVILGSAQDRLVIGEPAIEVPMVADLVPSIDVESGLIEVVDLPGLT